MKLIQNAALGVCLFTSIAVQAQQSSNDTTTKFTPPVIVKDADKVSKSESKKKEYESKQWHQGMEVMPDEKNKAADRSALRMHKKTGKQQAPPPPPPSVLPPAPPPPPPSVLPPVPPPPPAKP
jgi:hypothetical protein